MLSIFFCRKERPQHRPNLGQHGGRESENECGFLFIERGTWTRKKKDVLRWQVWDSLGGCLKQTVNWNKIFPTVVYNSLLDPDYNLVGHTNFLQ